MKAASLLMSPFNDSTANRFESEFDVVASSVKDI